jgi:hypothetical protein
MAKATPDPTLAAGERLLAEWGIPADAAVEELRNALARDPLADAAIACRLGRIATVESATALQRLEVSAADKRVRKEAKRARYRLSQRGIQAPDLPTAPAAPVTIAAAAIEGYVSPVDGRGDQLVWLVKPQAGGVAHLFAVINDPDGLRETALAAISRKSLKALREELERKHELRLVDVDWRYADFLIHRAFEWARARGTRMEGDYPAIRAQFARQAPPADIAPPVLARVNAAARDADPVLLAASSAVLAEPELRTWFLTADDLEPELGELASVKESPLVLSRVQQEERFDDVIRHAIDRIFAAERRASWARRLYEMAYVFAKTRRPERAAQAVAAARAFELGRPVADIALCADLVRTSLAFFFRASVEEAQEREQTSLVLTPQQAMARRPRA